MVAVALHVELTVHADSPSCTSNRSNILLSSRWCHWTLLSNTWRTSLGHDISPFRDDFHGAFAAFHFSYCWVWRLNNLMSVRSASSSLLDAVIMIMIYLPNGVLKVVRKALSSDRGTCLQVDYRETFFPLRRQVTSSTVGIWKIPLVSFVQLSRVETESQRSVFLFHNHKIVYPVCGFVDLLYDLVCSPSDQVWVSVCPVAQMEPFEVFFSLAVCLVRLQCGMVLRNSLVHYTYLYMYSWHVLMWLLRSTPFTPLVINPRFSHIESPKIGGDSEFTM